MKFFLLAGVAAATLMTQAAEAATFSYTGSIVQWIVPTTGRFRIVASGAQGGFAFNYAAGGAGVTLAGTFALTSGQQLDIAVGGIGTGAASGYTGGGGGGGSFVLSGGSALLIAGGGGGARNARAGGNASSGTSGGSTYVSAGGQAGAGGEGGAGGFNGESGSGGGAGFLSGGGSANGYGGSSLPTLAGGLGRNGGGNGGFGGGGGGWFNSGGGGGGFSGGAGSYYTAGGGGGSFNGGTDQQVLGFNSGDGSVSINAVAGAVPEPSVWSMLISGFGLVGFALRRRVRMVLQGG